MKKLNIALIVAALLALAATTASADMTYDFEDMIDYWTLNGWQPAAGEVSQGPLGILYDENNDVVVDSAHITQSNPLSYTHDINQEVDFIAGHSVTEAWLQLDFTNDESDDYGSILWGLIKWDLREYASYAYDGQGFVLIDEVDNDEYDLVLDIDWLNDDGMMDVTVAVSNPLGTGTAWLDHSKVYGTAVVPVPGAALLGVLGLSAAGMKLRRRKSA